MRGISLGLFAFAITGLTANATAGEAELARVAAAMKHSFEEKRQATMDRLDQDETQALCTAYADTPLPPAIAQKIAATNRATLQLPAAGQYLGDWKRGEQVAQTGTGLQYSDDPSKPAGGNCYACHELSGTELAFGTIGPSLRQYGKLRGTSTLVLENAWGKLYNSNAQMPCSNMPRFGHRRILTEQQLKDVMAYLFDAASPVNQ